MTILHMDSSARQGASLGRKLGRRLVDGLQATSNRDVIYRDVSVGLPFPTELSVGASFTPPAQRSPAQVESLRVADALIDELEAADVIVMTLPVYNFAVPGALKAWIDLVARAGRTFRYSESGPEGLLKGKVAYVIVTSGGVALGSAADFASPYLRHVLGFLGIDDVRLIDASGMALDAATAVARAEAQIDDAIAAWPSSQVAA